MPQGSSEPEPTLDVSAPPGYQGLDPAAEAWAEHERVRRKAWLDGPSEAEKASARRRLIASWAHEPGAAIPEKEAIDAQVDRWAAREHLRRTEWVSGPRGFDELADRILHAHDFTLTDRRERALRALSDAELAVRGLLNWMIGASAEYYDRLIEEGRDSVRRLARQQRVPY